MNGQTIFNTADKLLNNMSVPPRSSVRISIVPTFEYTVSDPNTKTEKKVSKCVCFDPYVLCEKLGAKRENLNIKAEEFYVNHKAEFEKHHKPTGYMIALFNKGDDYLFAYVYEHKKCDDVYLLITVFSKIVNDLYIPCRKPDFSKENFSYKLLFDEAELGDIICPGILFSPERGLSNQKKSVTARR